MDSPAAKKRILILGGGFAGAYTALHLEKQLASAPDVEIVLVSRENFVLFTPMLHEVAGADVAVADIVQPLRKVLRRTRIAIGCIEAIDLANKQVRVRSEGLARAFDFTYDQLVPRLWGVSVLDDQAAAGAIMWVPGSVIFLVPVAVLSIRLLDASRAHSATSNKVNYEAVKVE
jgi:hypothetical protein